MKKNTNLLKTEFHQLESVEILQQSPEALLGVSPEAAALLKEFDVYTIFDLASSSLFANAASLTNAGNELNNPFTRFGAPPRDIVIDTLTSDKRVDELQFAEVGILEGIGEEKQEAVQNSLNVKTVRDLSLYPPYIAAITLFNEVFFPENDPAFDPEAPSDLIPKAGEYPTERVQYTTLVLDSIHDNAQTVDFNSESFKPINIVKALKDNKGFTKIAEGALLTFNQSWFVQGVTLGQLLHSTALAPGESTRIAVIDWSRRERGNQSEQISETEDLTNDTTHNRSISEVTEAVAQEAQQGFSKTNSFGKTEQAGGSGGLDLGIASFGGSAATSSNSSEATSYSSSSGRRDLSASMSQQINDRTHQHAHATRSRRASVVKEVAQSEHESISTRVITNYNHMHALTIQYFEVVQVYRVEVQLTDAQRVVFVPVELINFNDPDIVPQFRGVLTRAALNAEVRDLLRNFDVVELRPSNRAAFRVFDLSANVRSIAAPVLNTTIAASATPASAATEVTTPAAPLSSFQYVKIPKNKIDAFRDNFWSSEQLSRLSNLLDKSVFRPKSSSVFLPSETQLVEAHIGIDDAKFSVIYTTKEGRRLTRLPEPMLLTDLGRLAVKGSFADRDADIDIILTLSKNGVIFPLHFPAVSIPKNSTETVVVELINAGLNANLRNHLNENRQHYSQAIFRSLSSTEIAAILSGFTMKIGTKTVPVVQVVDPKPVGYVGNYLAFLVATDNAANGEDASWNEFKKARGIVLGKIQADIVPLSSGGVFAEAVMGRSNSAEKLDITRFWNWQDSPIPIQPTEIAAIQTGTRARDLDLSAGQLSNPIVNITTPTQLPDPTGMAGILTALQNGSMFRDMSGLAQNIALAQAALQASAAGATSAGSQAIQAQTVHLQAQVEKMKIAADLLSKFMTGGASGLAGGGGGSSSIGKNPSTDGSLINFFDKNSNPADGANSSSGSPATVTPGETPTSGDGGTSSGNSSATPAQNTSGANNPAARAAVFGPLGEPAGPIVNKLVDSPLGGATPAVKTDELKIEQPAHPQFNNQVAIIREIDSSTGKHTFFVTNATHDTFRIRIILKELKGLTPSPADANGKTFLSKGQTTKVKIFELTPAKPKDPFNYEIDIRIAIGDSSATHTNANSYALPFEKGKKFTCTQGFNGSGVPADKQTHTDDLNKFAVDLALPDGTIVCAARGGVVVEFDKDQPNSGGDANFIRILHNDGTYGSYLHLQNNGVSVSLGDVVKAGDPIGLSGNSGNSSGAHLHFAVLKANGEKRDSIRWGFAIDNGADPVANKEYDNV